MLRLLGAWLLLELLTRHFYGFALSRRATRRAGGALHVDTRLTPPPAPAPTPTPTHPPLPFCLRPRQVGCVPEAGAAAALRLRLLAAEARLAQVRGHLALLPAVGGPRRRGRTGEPARVHLAPVHAQRLLALLARLLQPVARALRLPSAGRARQRARGPLAQPVRRLRLRRAVARRQPQAPRVGRAAPALLRARARRRGAPQHPHPAPLGLHPAPPFPPPSRPTALTAARPMPPHDDPRRCARRP